MKKAMKLGEIIKMMEEELSNEQDKQVDWKEMIRRLEERGIQRDDIDDAIDEAERRKIIRIENGICKWLDPGLRDAEKAKTQRYFEILSDIFKDGKIGFLPREDLKSALRERGMTDKEIRRVFSEATRDHVLDSYSTSFVQGGDLVDGCSWIPPNERKRYAEAEKRNRKRSEKWIEKKLMQEETWDD